ncbi:hypothetical protein ABBQ32_008861 [Trebouxia sp. C0010 RCD-2024]
MTQLLSLFSAWARGCSSFLATTLAGASQVDHAEHQPAQASRTSSGKPLLWVAAEFGSDVHAVVSMSDRAAHDVQDLARTEAAQETYSYREGRDSFEEGDLPNSPQTSDCDWELLPDAAVPSSCGSSAKSVHDECALVSIPYPENTANVTPHLHIQLMPQGSSDVSLRLTVQDPAASHSSDTSLLSEHAQSQYQEQLLKAQQTLLPQARQASAIEKSSIPEAQHQQQDILYDEHEVGSMAALEEDDTLPTSTQMSMQEHMADTVSAADSLSAPSMQGPHLLPESNSVGHLSVMSDGSFIHVGGPASAGDAECQEGLEARTLLDDTMAVDLTGPAVVEDVAQEANTVDRLSEGTSEHVAEFLSEHAEAVGESDKEQGDAEVDAAHRHVTWRRLMAAIQQRWIQLLSTLQVWTSSAYDLLPSSASVYASTASLLGSKSPLRRFDRVHWSLMSGLVVVSAVYLVREHGHSIRERRLRKELINSQAEISKLVMKVINMQHSMQSTGRVPIIRHTCSMSAVAPFPLMHLV